MPKRESYGDQGDKKEDEVVDSNYSLAVIWPLGDKSFALLQYIDPYGSTVFNRLQMPEVENELDLLVGRASGDEQRDVLRRMRELPLSCQTQPQMFLRSKGDWPVRRDLISLNGYCCEVETVNHSLQMLSEVYAVGPRMVFYHKIPHYLVSRTEVDSLEEDKWLAEDTVFTRAKTIQRTG